MLETQCLWHSRIPTSSSEDLCPGEYMQRHHQHYLASTQISPNWRRKGAYFALFLLMKIGFVPRSTAGKNKMAVSPSRCWWARAQPPRQPCQTRTLGSSAGVGSVPQPVSVEDLTSLWTAVSPCPALLDHAIRLVRFVCTCSSGYPKHPLQCQPLIILQHPSHQLGQAPEQLVIPALGCVVKWDRHSALQAKEDTTIRETAFQNKN